MSAPSDRGIGDKATSARIMSREKQIGLHTKNRKAVQGRFLDFDSEFKAPNYPKSKDDVKFLDEALGENFIFSDLTTKERSLLIKAMQKQECKEGELIIQQGDTGDFFYICEQGRITFVADGKDVGSCGKGGSFGELSLLYDSPRAATCVASSDAKLWKVDQATFRNLLARGAKDQEADIVDVLMKVPLLKDMDRGLISKFSTVLTIVKFSEGETIVKKGDEGDIFYIINEGQVRVHDIGLGDASYADQMLKGGDWFGERALDRNTFEATIGSLEDILGHESKKRFIKSVPIFAKSELLQIEYDHLVKLVSEKKYKKGHKLAEAGKSGKQYLWIVKEGKLMISSASGEIFFLGSGDYFGDKAVRERGEYVSEETCLCEEDTVCWVLKRSDIESVIGDVKRLGKSIPFVPTSLNTAITLKDVKKHRILGMGMYPCSHV
jgi:cAMP-dependent protein kinase regulator